MFFSLQNYTTYSILSGVGQPEQWVARADELGYPALGVCDKGNLGSFIEFQKECDKKDIKPIFGAEFTIVDDRTKKSKTNNGYVQLFVKDEEGFKNLIWLNNHAQTRVDDGGGFYYRPRLDLEVISEHAEGLICVVTSNDGAFLENSAQRFSEFLLKAYDAFGDDFYVGINLVDGSGLDDKDLGVWQEGLYKCIPTFNCHYPIEQQSHLYEIVRKLDRGATKMSKNLDRDVEDGYLPSECPAQLSTEYLAEIYNKCDYRIPLGVSHMPKPDLEKANNLEDEVVWHLCKGLERKLLTDFDSEEVYEALTEEPDSDSFEDLVALLSEEYSEQRPKHRIDKYYTEDEKEHLADERPISEYVERLEEEFKVIQNLGFLDYFLIVREICQYADDNEIERGPARGSAAGSLFSFLLDITKVDPLEFNLLFSRFLNPDRNDLPDIDLDFSTEKREQIKDYIAEKYGRDKVVSIGSYERLKIASAVKNIAKVYGYGIRDNSGDIVHYSRDALSDILSGDVPATARGEDELRERREYRAFDKFYRRHKSWFDTVVMPLQETISNTSVHAAGTLVTAFPVDECMPVRKRTDGTVLSQWKDRYCEERGFPKFDILGVKAVDMISYAKKLIKKHRGEDVPAIEDLPLNDPKVIEVFKQAKTDGVFQFKSWVQHQLLPKVDPDTFDDLVACTALGRPGPQEAMADEMFAKIKNGEMMPPFEHDDMVPITHMTYGLIIYQEQIMKIVQEIGGLTGSESDYVRKACGKKQLEKMRKWEKTFKDGAADRGYDQELAEDLWGKIVAFAEYGFNLSHSVSYTLISYYHAWLKAYYPVEYWCAALKYAPNDPSKYHSMFNIKSKARDEGVDFIYPNIFGFAEDFEPASVNEGKVYWPLIAIKGIGEKTSQKLTADGARNTFNGIEDMLETMGMDIHLGHYKILIEAGFFEPLTTSDKPWLAAREVIYTRNRLLDRKDDVPFKMTSKSLMDWYEMRNDRYGFIVRPWKEVGHFHSNIQRFTESEFKRYPDETPIFIGGYVDEVRTRAQKNNKNKFWGRIIIKDEGEEYLVMAWSSFWENMDLDIEGNRPVEGDLVELIGMKGSWQGRPQITIGKPDAYIKVIKDEKTSIT